MRYLALSPEPVTLLQLPLQLCLEHAAKHAEAFTTAALNKLNVLTVRYETVYPPFRPPTPPYILNDVFILGHAGSQKLLLHLQYGGFLRAQPLLLGVLHMNKQYKML